MIQTIFAFLVLSFGLLAATDGPYNGLFLASGNGLKKPMTQADSGLWTISAWLDWDGPQAGTVLIGGFGDPASEHRYLAIVDGKLGFSTGNAAPLTTEAGIPPHQLVQVSAVYNGGKLTLYLDHKSVSETSLTLASVAREIQIAPFVPGGTHFAGRLAAFQIASEASIPSEAAPDMATIQFEHGSEDWPFQTRQQVGYRAPQSPSTLPKSPVPFSKARSQPESTEPALVPVNYSMLSNPGGGSYSGAEKEWVVHGWHLAAAPGVHSEPAEISKSGFNVQDWYAATVPGTVLTTLIDRGVYPDPAYGLNNLEIPESLNKQDYWYRTEFSPPAKLSGQHLTLTFNGINYLARVWLNGTYLGQIKGAFLRGIFNVTDILIPGQANVLLVRISPPPHPGIPQEQSVKAGPGENGGALCLDGPTFVATEGWDWIPGVRDRNIGLWQDVRLKASNEVTVGDPQVISNVPLPDTSRATVTIRVPLHNNSGLPVKDSLHASFEGFDTQVLVTAKPGDSEVTLQAEVSAPRLWWPNGYGEQNLYHLNLAFGKSDEKSVRFGIREITYELSLMDHTGNLRRVEIDPARATKGERIVEISHEHILHSNRGWVYSLNPAAENSPAVRILNDTQLTPYLAIRVNGVRIAARGGSWGMDDYLKRVSREHLEPFFKLHHDANLNMIRNWVGQSTEETFYDLADEYGLLVWNDFWQSTQNYNVEPTDTGLFLENAGDTIKRFRNHPSIVLWCGRNEGVPAPALNEALDELIRETDGTRYYAPSSNTINLQDSGPYRYFEPADYFTKFDRGFAVEVGIPSFPTLEAFKSFVPPSQQWPPNDTWAYHDWHESGNGVVGPFMDALTAHYGAPTSLEDFERKAQLMNYIGHRAIFEGMNAHLWTANSGRMLWMTQPAWPSTVWQILSYDYDTQASYYGVKKASEQVHIQMNLPDLDVAVVNNTVKPLAGLTARARIFGLDGHLLSTQEQKLEVAPSSVTATFNLMKAIPLMLVFIRLDLLDTAGAELSQNFYWYANTAADYQALNQLPAASLKASGTLNQRDSVMVTLRNPGKTVSFMNKLTLRDSKDGNRILPAYYDDNYVSLLPGESRQIRIGFSPAAVHGSVQVGISGFQQQPITVNIQQ